MLDDYDHLDTIGRNKTAACVIEPEEFLQSIRLIKYKNYLNSEQISRLNHICDRAIYS